MGQELGNYIHLYYQNYINNGTDREGQKVSPAAILSEWHKNIKESFKSKNLDNVNIDELRTFEALLNIFGDNAMIEQIKKEFNWKDSDIQNLRNLFKEKLNEVINILGGGGNIVTDLGTNFLTATGGGASVEGLKAFNQYKPGNIPFEDINKVIETLKRVILNTQKSAQSIFEGRLLNIETNLSIIKSDLQIVGINSRHNLITQLNQLIKDIKKYNIETFKGPLGEAFVALVAQVGKELKTHQITECINIVKEHSVNNLDDLGVVGDQTSTKIFSEKTFGKMSYVESNNDRLKAYYSIGQKDFLLGTLTRTQDKVDVMIDFGNPAEQLKVGASVKNYSKSTIKIVSGNGIKLIQDYGEYLNHYLNIISTNTLRKKENVQPEAKLIQSAHDTLKLSFLIQALAGGQLISEGEGRNAQAEILIVIINGKARVIPIKDIINEIVDSLHTDHFSAMSFKSEGSKFTTINTAIPKNDPDGSIRCSRIVGTFLKRFRKIDIHLKLHKLTLGISD